MKLTMQVALVTAAAGGLTARAHTQLHHAQHADDHDDALRQQRQLKRMAEPAHRTTP